MISTAFWTQKSIVLRLAAAASVANIKAERALALLSNPAVHKTIKCFSGSLDFDSSNLGSLVVVILFLSFKNQIDQTTVRIMISGGFQSQKSALLLLVEISLKNSGSAISRFEFCEKPPALQSHTYH